MNDSIEPAIDGTAGDIPEISIDWLFRSPWLGITHWDCAGARRELSDERRQLWHSVCFVHSGAFILHIRGRSAMIDTTSVLLHNPGEPYRSEHPFDGCDRGSAIVIHRQALLDLLAHYDPAAEERPQALFPHSHLQGLDRAYLLQRLLVRSLRGAAPREPLAIEEAVLKVLEQVAAGCRQTQGRAAGRRRETSRARRGYTEDAKALLQRRLRERLQLDDIARSLYVSPFHLCRLFRKETGVPIHRYLNRLRLREALEPITEGETDLSGLARGLGFSSHSHFTAAFRKEFGVSPRGMKKLTTVRIAEMVRSLGL